MSHGESWNGLTRRCGTSGDGLGRWDDWRAMFDPDAAELRGPAERLVKAAFGAVAGGFDEALIARVREILERALQEISELGRNE